MDTSQRVAIGASARRILRNPGYLETLQDKIGLNHVTIWFSGELPPEVMRHNPFDGFPPSDECVRSLLARHIDGRPSTDVLTNAKESIAPFVGPDGNDGELREAIRRARSLGLQVHMSTGVWTATDFDVLMYCPSRERVNGWFEALYTYIATNYDIKGLAVTHARYPMTSHPRGMFLCTCDSCAQAASEMGYDMGQMVDDIYDGLDRLKRMEGKRVIDICKEAAGPFDLMQILAMKQGVVQWFKFRAELIAREMSRFRRAVHAAAGDDFIFGTDTYPASLAMFVGHNHAVWDEFSDYASPLLAHVDVFPMETLVVWAEFLRSLYPDVSEADALQAVYRLVGYDSLNMPLSIEDFCLGAPDCEFRNIPLKDMLMLDLAKARLYLPPDVPSYPIIQGGGDVLFWRKDNAKWPRQIVEDLIAGAKALGHQGIALQGTKSLVDFELKD